MKDCPDIKWYAFLDTDTPCILYPVKVKDSRAVSTLFDTITCPGQSRIVCYRSACLTLKDLQTGQGFEEAQGFVGHLVPWILGFHARESAYQQLHINLQFTAIQSEVYLELKNIVRGLKKLFFLSWLEFKVQVFAKWESAFCLFGLECDPKNIDIIWSFMSLKGYGVYWAWKAVFKEKQEKRRWSHGIDRTAYLLLRMRVYLALMIIIWWMQGNVVLCIISIHGIWFNLSPLWGWGWC